MMPAQTQVSNAEVVTPEVAKTMMQSSPLNFRRFVIWIGRLVLGGIFIYAGYSKIFLPNFMFRPLFALRFSLSTNLSNFAFQVESYKLLSPGGVSLVAHTLPFVEITLGLLLLVGWRLRIWATPHQRLAAQAEERQRQKKFDRAAGAREDEYRKTFFGTHEPPH